MLISLQSENIIKDFFRRSTLNVEGNFLSFQERKQKIVYLYPGITWKLYLWAVIVLPVTQQCERAFVVMKSYRVFVQKKLDKFSYLPSVYFQ